MSGFNSVKNINLLQSTISYNEIRAKKIDKKWCRNSCKPFSGKSASIDHRNHAVYDRNVVGLERKPTLCPSCTALPYEPCASGTFQSKTFAAVSARSPEQILHLTQLT